MPSVLSVLNSGSRTVSAYAATSRRPLSSSGLLPQLLQYLRFNKAMGLSTIAVAAVFVFALRDRPAKSSEVEERIDKEGEKESEQGGRAARVDRHFFVSLLRLLRIAVPGLLSREAFYLSVLTLVLCIRTFLSIRITGVNGEIVKAIVQRDFPAFLSRLTILASIAIPASIVNSLLKFLRGRIALCFRSRLTARFHDRYLHANMFYSVLQLDSRISNPDQALTETIDKWFTRDAQLLAPQSVSCSQLYSDITKPLLDIVLFAWRISDVIGPLGPLSVVVYYAFCALVIQSISPRFGRMTAQTQRLEGAFRSAHHRLITSSEEVAFYGGQEREKAIINGKFTAVVVNQAETFRQQLAMGVLDGFLTKYGAVLLGYSVLGLPSFGPGSSGDRAAAVSDPAQLTRDYVRNSGLLINFSQAIGRIVTSYKELQRLAGFTSLVSELEAVLEDLDAGKYQRTMLTAGLRAGLHPGAGVVSVDEERISFSDCFSESDTRVLTNCGLLFLDQIEALLDKGQAVLFGCYDVASKGLHYCPGQLVYRAAPQELLDFTSEDEAAPWTTASGLYGTAALLANNPYSCHVSLRVTPGHDMYVQRGNRGRSGNVTWAKHGGGVPVPPRREPAHSLLSDCHCPRAQDDCVHRRAHIRLLACAEAGYAPQATRQRRAVQSRLHLDDAQFAAFLELLGFWLGDGSMAYRQSSGGYDAVAFAQLKETDRRWLEATLAQVGLRPSQWRSCSYSREEQALLVTDKDWFAFFDKEFGRKYPGSQYCSSAAATPPSTTRSRAPSLTRSSPSASPARRSSLSAATMEPATPRPGTGLRRCSVSFSSTAELDMALLPDADEDEGEPVAGHARSLQRPVSAAAGLNAGQDDAECVVCHSRVADDSHPTLLCDGSGVYGLACQRGPHLRCDGREEVPDGDWYCDRCSRAEAGGAADDEKDVPRPVTFHAVTPPSTTRSLRASSWSSASASSSSTPLPVSISSFSFTPRGRAISAVSTDPMTDAIAAAAMECEDELKDEEDEEEADGSAAVPIDLTGRQSDDDVKLDDAGAAGPPPAQPMKDEGEKKDEKKGRLGAEDEPVKPEPPVDDEPADPDEEMPQPPVEEEEKLPPTPAVLPPGWGSWWRPAVQPDPVKSVNHLPDWTLQELTAAEMRLLIAGLHRADGSFAAQENEISTSSPHFRDQLMQALLHCGYSAYAGLKYAKGSIRGYEFHDQSKDRTTYPVSFFDRLSAAKKRNYRPITATADAWKVSYTEPGASAAAASCWPSLPRQSGITRVPHSAVRDGRTWCVEVEHADHLIIAQRAHRDDGGIVTKQSRPIVVGNCPIVTPNGDLLVDHVTFTVSRGQNLMIVGPNGCGKSSLFRILGGLWPLWGGRLQRPSQSHLFYIPQKPYLCSGTLRDNVVYPDTLETMRAKGESDAGLESLLSSVHLLYLLERPGGWDADEEWADVLSGGEKQRLAMARLFYHRPSFAILDECTSAVSVDVEGFMYRHSRQLGISLITISHRQTLWQFHDFLLRFEDQEETEQDRRQQEQQQGRKGSERSRQAKRVVTFTKMSAAAPSQPAAAASQIAASARRG